MPLACVRSHERDDDLFADDRYFVRLTVRHTAGRAVRGRFRVRAGGDVFGAGGRDDGGLGDNDDESETRLWEPGAGDGFSVYHDLDAPGLKSDDVPHADVDGLSDVSLRADSLVDGDDANYRDGNWDLRL